MNLHYFIQGNFGKEESFQWSDTITEAKYFHYNNGQDENG